MKLKITTDVEEDKQIVYLLDMDIDGTQVIKIGVTGRKIEDRVVEILTSFFYKYRYFCRLRPKRFRKTTNAYEKEAQLLEHFKEYKYESEHKFSGCTELITGIDLDVVVAEYERVLDGSNEPRKDD